VGWHYLIALHPTSFLQPNRPPTGPTNDVVRAGVFFKFILLSYELCRVISHYTCSLTRGPVRVSEIRSWIGPSAGQSLCLRCCAYGLTGTLIDFGPWHFEQYQTQSEKRERRISAVLTTSRKLPGTFSFPGRCRRHHHMTYLTRSWPFYVSFSLVAKLVF
jgi:hypothetical protein